MPRLTLTPSPQQTADPVQSGYGVLPGVLPHCQWPNPHLCAGCLKEVAQRLAENLNYSFTDAEYISVMTYALVEGLGLSYSRANILKQYTEEICKADHDDGYDVLIWVQHNHAVSAEPLIDQADVGLPPAAKRFEKWLAIVCLLALACWLGYEIAKNFTNGGTH